MTEAKKCRTLLIEDSPALEDAFGSKDAPGPHQRVAEAIAELIESSESGGKVIGLEGGWGAGKSTVVNLLRQRFDKNSLHTVIAFDAWAHEGDPLRRTYLETLIRQLQVAGWAEKDACDKKLDAISHRRRETSTRTVPKPTKLGTVIAFSLFGVPLGSPLVTAALRDGATERWGLTPLWQFVFGSLLILAPFIVLLFNSLILGINRIRKGKSADETKWAMLLSHAITETRTETVESPNPTSIEFEDHFANVMRDALAGKHGRRLLLVLDNLDRVDPANALAIWSTLQTFLQDRQHRQEDWFKRIWILVPFDSNGLRKLWDNRLGKNPNGPEVTHDEARPASDSFLDKSFQIRFSVPPTILSDWKAFLCRVIEQALPDHDSNDRHLLYRIFDHCRPHTDSSPTPRELKLFVNQIGAIHRQWQHTFPIGHIAYFVLRCPERNSFIEQLRASKLPKPEDIRMLGVDLQASLAGLAFNVTAERGLELLLAEPIHQALTKGDDGKLKELAQRHNDGFWAVLEVAAETKLGGNEGSTLSMVALGLDRSQLLESAFRPEFVTVRSSLRHAAEAAKKWSPFDKQMADGINALCRLQGDEDFSKSMLNAVTSVFSATSGESKESLPQPRVVVDALLIVLGGIEQLGHQNAIPATFTLPIDAIGWREACQELAARQPSRDYWNRFRPRCEFTEISSIIEAAVTAGEFKPDDFNTIKVTNASLIRSSWSAVVASARQRLDAAQSVVNPESQVLLSLLHELRSLDSSEAASAIKDLANEGHLMHHFQRANSKKQHDCRAMCAFLFLRERPNAEKPTVVGNSEAGHQSLISELAATDPEFVVRFTNLLRQNEELDLLFRIVDSRSSYDPFVGACLREVASNNSPQTLFTTQAIRSRWPTLRPVLDEGQVNSHFTTLVGHLARETDLCSTIQNGDGGFSVVDAGLYRAMLEGAKEDIPTFSQWCADGLSGLSKEIWNGDFCDGFACSRLMLDLVRQEKPLSLSTPFADALAQHAAVVRGGEQIPPDVVREEWSTLVERLGDGGIRKVFRERLAKIATGRDGAINSAFFEIYGSELNDSEILEANEEIVSQLFSPLVRDRNVAGLRWLDGFFKTDSDFLKKVATRHTVEEFETRLRHCVTEPTDDAAQPLINEIATVLGIEAIREDAGIQPDHQGEGT